MKDPCVNGIGDGKPMWVWKSPIGYQFFDPDGLQIVAPKSVMYNPERAAFPPPSLA